MTVDLSALSLTESQPAWAGFNVELSYDPSVLAVANVVQTSLCPGTHWALIDTTPQIRSGCWGMMNTSTGVLQTMTLRCLKDGTSPVHFLVPGEPGGLYFSNVFDPKAFDLQMTPQDASVTCDSTTDADADACTNTAEMALGLNPLNTWDYFDVPAPALLDAPNPASIFRDGAIGAADAQAVFRYFAAGAHTGTAIYDQDLDGNGIADGLEYDRSVLGPGMSGPPDGTVTVRDAQLAFAQFKLGYHC